MKSRAVPGSGISFPEIEVDLCNIPSREELAQEQLEDDREKEGNYGHCEGRNVCWSIDVLLDIKILLNPCSGPMADMRFSLLRDMKEERIEM